MLVGRKKEQSTLRKLVEKEDSQFCVVYGRRRVGKTYLVRETFNYQFAFQHTGLAKAPLAKQLAAFRDSLQRAGSLIVRRLECECRQTLSASGSDGGGRSFTDYPFSE